MMKTTVAVVIPVFNGEATVLEALSSVDRQSYRNFVIIAVDDGSTDKSLALLNDFAASRSNVVVLTHTNKGAAYSRNRGIRYVMEQDIPYIAFLDADDVWHEDKLAWQMNAFELHPETDIVVVRHAKYEQMHDLKRLEFEEHRIQLVDSLFEALCLGDFVFQPVSYLAKIEVFNGGFFYDARFPCGEDFLPFLYFGYKDMKIRLVDVPLYFERSLQGSLQRSRSAAFYGHSAKLAAIDEILSSYGSDPGMTDHRTSLLLRARDRYLSGMIYGARHCLSYPKCLLIVIRSFTHYRDKRLFLIEFFKTILFPLTVLISRRP